MFKNKKGFTLIELLAVIALLAVITIIAVTAIIPRGENAKKRAFLDEVKVYYKASDEIDLYDDTSIKCLNISELNDNYVKKDNGNYSGCMYVYPDGSTRLNITNGKYYAITTGDVTINDIVDTKPADFISSCTDNSKSYTITYDLDGGTLTTANPTSYKFNTETITLNNPTKSGYRFVGWSSKNLFDKTKYDQLSEFPGSGSYKYAGILLKPNTTYKISVKRYHGFDGKGNGYLLISPYKEINNTWSAIAHNKHDIYSISNYLYTTNGTGLLYIGYNGMSQSNLDTVWSGTDVQLEEGDAATDYQDYMAPTKSAKIYRGSIGNKKFIANWEEASGNYTITYNLDGGTVSSENPTSYNINTPTFTLNNPTQDGKIFLGWSEGDSTTILQTVTIPQGTVGNKTYIAHFVNDKYKVTYNYNITSAQTVNNANYIDTGFIPDTNYDFSIAAKMKISTAAKRYLLFGNYPAASHINLEINAANKSRIYITKSSNIDKVSTVAVPSGQEFDLKLDYTALTYSYFFRLSNSNFTADISGEADNIMNTVMPKSLLVGNDYRGGSNPFGNTLTVKDMIISRYYPYDNTLSDLPVVVRPGYVFDGWYTAASGGSKVTTSTKVKRDVTYYAHYTAS